MKDEQKGKIDYAKPELVDLDGGEGIAGSRSNCENGNHNSYCTAGTSARGSGCDSGSNASCSTGSTAH